MAALLDDGFIAVTKLNSKINVLKGHTSRHTSEEIVKTGWEVLPHLHLFGQLKEAHRGIPFEDEKPVKATRGHFERPLLADYFGYFEIGFKQEISTFIKRRISTFITKSPSENLPRSIYILKDLRDANEQVPRTKKKINVPADPTTGTDDIGVEEKAAAGSLPESEVSRSDSDVSYE
ncbi:hypothetical protein Trydic_g22349 [Trypoxylus dichotomus]